MNTLMDRAGGCCELCSATDSLAAIDVAPRPDAQVLLCATCAPQVSGQTDLDPRHWFCLQQSAWSQEPAVQVVAWRLLQQLRAEPWAADLLDQLYIEDDVLAWARQGLPDSDAVPTLDANGTALADGDTITLVRSLDVKGGGFTAKRGTVVKNIRLTDDPGLIEGKVERVAIFLKTEFVKKTG